ncbi:MAG: DNA translocase FtsK [Clostridia bacterium]|nr:DNA translocase FtsK [Clostridia bacterium]
MKMRAERRREAERIAAERDREFEYETEESDGIAVPPEPEPFDATQPYETAVPNPDFDMNFSDDEFATKESPAVKEKSVAEAVVDSYEPEEEPENGATPIENAIAEGASVYTENGEIDLRAIFVDEDPDEDVEVGAVDISDALEEGVEVAESLPVSKTDMGEEGELVEKPKPKVEKPVYHFPSITLLSKPEQKKNEDVGSELRANAQKLVETLRSFRVNVTISSVSRGPTITRYELIPEAGTRVRAIANLVDDISLALATSGIRIEAPIPGKAAVGIEVPNRVVSTVTLRELIENPAFAEAKSKLTVCLGKDVGGTPIMFDIAKMPHLLIAGATGMGKSVCINSIIASILYKATPDEVKLILIDPKKVEFNIYNGIPHLQIPVVSEPKKAAGALHWAVTEMERRYELIEEVGARKIETYNEIARKRGMEVLPYTVIIIDELADLMMTAPDAVEDSICRLAQKARAAGMHIIIGTQRPSVDVITGLIKANIPSRIAFTVASQVDSRTIIDIAGAEKLIGRGDMLYYPVGLSKPMRAQGAFISEDEVEKITEFVKQSVGETEYDSDIMESIEREAQAIGQTQKKGSGEAMADDGAGDPKLRDALEIATDLGKISTSLLQRKLSIGYGRAAKIIDIMEARGFVSAPEGQKPREVLITKTQFREMVVSGDERIN